MNKLKSYLTSWRAVAVLAVIVALIWLAAIGLPDGRLHVYFLNVGQGDAILIVAPDGRQTLIDGGPSPAALLNELGAVMPFWDRSLDLVVLTHPDLDHMAGLSPALARYRVTHALSTPLSASAPQAAAWRDALAAAGVTPTVAVPGLRVLSGGPTLTVLRASSSESAGFATDDNNESLVLRLDYGATSFLFTGDAEEMAERALLSTGAPLRADVLKVGHHGSNRSTSAAFLTAVAPRLAVISVGADNRFGHPHPDVLQRLAGIRVLRTDQSGRIEITSDGKALWVGP
jgi:competence protein ComEC